MKGIGERNQIIGRIRSAFWQTSEDSDIAEYLIELVKKDSDGIVPLDMNMMCMGHRLGDLIVLAEAYMKDGKRIEDITAAIKTGYDMARREAEETLKRVVEQHMQAIFEHPCPDGFLKVDGIHHAEP